MYNGLVGLKIGLVLSGGAVRGFAHIGVLKAFQREGLTIDMVAGTSSGAIVGAMYAAGMDPWKMETLAKEINWRDIVSPTWPPKEGLLSGDRLARFIRERVRARYFSSLRLPLAVVAVDILSQRQYIFRRGRLDIAVQASCAVPGIFKPVPYRGMLLVDGGVLANLPSEAVKEMGADIVVGVDVNRRDRLFKRLDNIFKILLQCQYIMMEASTRRAKELCDYVIEPDMGKGGFLALERASEFIDLGEKAALPVVKKIKRRRDRGV